MPPKQKQAKKGPNYKAPILAKDIVPADVKQLPRELKSLKYPQTFTQPPKNDKKTPSIFESWPAQQVIKAFDFGINSQNRFEDLNHELISKILQNDNIVGWKPIHEIEKIKAQYLANQNTQSMESINENQPKSIQEIEANNQDKQPAKDPVIIETYQRDETQQEMQFRLKQQAQKAEKAAKDKKKGKKEEPKQQGPIKVRDVKMSDIKVQEYMPQQTIWIGSQLQTIKLRNIVDPYVKEAVWKKIYPQQNGVPQITKSGKYWVKLYYMGQPVKIEVDDRIPLNSNYKEIFPTSQKKHQKWTLILTKALLKYFALAWPNEKISGSGLIIHALTGMLSQTIALNTKSFQRFESLLNDEHYTKRDVFLSCFTDNIQIPPSNFIKSPQEARQFALLQASKLKGNKQLEVSQQDLYQRQQVVYQGQIGPIEPNILPGYAYLMGDYFTNGQFNMAFSKQRSEKEAKLRLQYNNLSKINLNNKTRDQKLQHRRKKKQIKELLAIQQKKRLDFISAEKKEYHFIKLLNQNVRIRCQFDEKEIMLAKKCRLNNVNQPPNYELPQTISVQKEDVKSMKSISVIKTAKQDHEVNPNIDDFSSLQNVSEPLSRHDQGIWIKNIDFLSCFTNVQIIYNPTKFVHKSIEKIGAGAQDGSFLFDESKQILVVEKLQMNQEGIQAQNIDLLFGFSYQQSAIPLITSPYCVLQKFDFDQFAVTSNVTKLDAKIDSTLLTLKNQNNVFKIYPMCKTNYCFWVSSNSKFKLMSISEYLQEFQGYKKKIFTVEYPAIEGKNYFPTARFSIREASEQNNSVILKINSQNPDFAKNTRYNLVKAPQQTEKFISNDVEGVIRKSCQQKHLALDYTRLNIQSNQSYDLVLETSPSENISDGSFEIVALIKNQSLTFDHSEMVEPLKFIDKYRPNKYGLILRERIFSNVLTKQGFSVKIVQGQEIQGGAGDKKAIKKGGKQEPTVQFVEKPLQQNKTIIVKIVKNKQTIYETTGTNWTTISNIRIANLKEKPTDQYFLEASFDLRQWPQACMESELTAKLCWTVSIFGTDSIALVRDTRQQQKQKQTRKSWQDQQPGRAERAKKSRRRFLILQKKQNGQHLTQEQELIINAPRLTKKQQLQQQKKNEDKNKKGGKKDDKKGGKQVKKQQVQEKPVHIIFPKSSDNCNFQIRNFLKTLQNFSVRKLENDENKEARIRSDEELRAIKESQKMVDENRINKMLRNVQRRETIKLKERDKKDQLLIQLEQLNRLFKTSWSKYVTWRNEDLEKDKTKQEKERVIVDILKNQKPILTEAEVDKILNQYQQINGFNQKLYDVAVMLKKNIKIQTLTDKISGHLIGWEIEQLKAINEIIKNQKIEGIQQNILNDMKTILEEAEKNPGLVTEKQNEAKKAKKGGKK